MNCVAHLGAGSFFQSSVGDPHQRAANVEGFIVHDSKSTRDYKVFRAKRDIEKGEQLLYYYKWHASEVFPWWIFFPDAVITSLFPSRNSADAKAYAFVQLNYTHGHAHPLRGIAKSMLDAYDPDSVDYDPEAV